MKHLYIAALLLSGCASIGMGNHTPVIVKTHLYDILQNDSMTGTDPDAIYIVVQDRLAPNSQVKISAVPKAKRVIAHPAGLDEYYVAFDVARLRLADLNKVYLFHSDRVGNGGILRLEHDQTSGFSFEEVPADEVSQVRQGILLGVSSRYIMGWFTPRRVRDFIKAYEG